MTISSSVPRRVFAALTVVAAGWASPLLAQTGVGDLGSVSGVHLVERSWSLNVHAIAASLLDISGDLSQTGIAGEDADLRGWGVEGATLGKRFTFLVGFEERTLEEDVNFLEVYGGSKLNFKQRGPWAPYLVGILRYSQDMKFPTTPETSSLDFFGWSAGGGVAYHATDRFFIDARVVYEGLFQDIDARMGRDIGMGGAVATVGAGFTF